MSVEVMFKRNRYMDWVCYIDDTHCCTSYFPYDAALGLAKMYPEYRFEIYKQVRSSLKKLSYDEEVIGKIKGE